jgi:hypothetical protein
LAHQKIGIQGESMRKEFEKKLFVERRFRLMADLGQLKLRVTKKDPTAFCEQGIIEELARCGKRLARLSPIHQETTAL